MLRRLVVAKSPGERNPVRPLDLEERAGHLHTVAHPRAVRSTGCWLKLRLAANATFETDGQAPNGHTRR
jgi:hypothetical protein